MEIGFLEKIRMVKKGVEHHRNLAGVLICLALFLSGFFIHGQVGLYCNLAGFLIVVGGTLGAALISFRVDRLVVVWKVLTTSLRHREKNPEEIIEILVDLSLKRKFQGLLSLQEDEEQETVLFLRHALGLLVDGYEVIQIRDFLNTEIYFFRMRREEIERILRTLAEICPSFGLVGSVVGLIGMLAGVGDTTTILATIPIALTSTLYGVVIANFVFLPVAAHVRERTDHEILLQKIIMEGAVGIAGELHPRALETKLKSFLTPSLRKGKIVSLRRIREKFKIKEEERSDLAQNADPLPVAPEAAGEP